MENIQDIILYELNKMETSYHKLKESDKTEDEFLFTIVKETYNPIRISSIRGYLISKTEGLSSLTLNETFPLFIRVVKNYFNNSARDKVADATMKDLFFRICQHMNHIATDIVPHNINNALMKFKS